MKGNDGKQEATVGGSAKSRRVHRIMENTRRMVRENTLIYRLPQTVPVCVDCLEFEWGFTHKTPPTLVPVNEHTIVKGLPVIIDTHKQPRQYNREYRNTYDRAEKEAHDKEMYDRCASVMHGHLLKIARDAPIPNMMDRWFDVEENMLRHVAFMFAEMMSWCPMRIANFVRALRIKLMLCKDDCVGTSQNLSLVHATWNDIFLNVMSISDCREALCDICEHVSQQNPHMCVLFLNTFMRYTFGEDYVHQKDIDNIWATELKKLQSKQAKLPSKRSNKYFSKIQRDINRS